MASTEALEVRLIDPDHCEAVWPLSVEAAFTLAEVQALAAEAGMAGATISRHWPCRYLLAWRRA